MTFFGTFAILYLLYLCFFVIIDISAFVVVWQSFVTNDLLRRFVSARARSVIEQGESPANASNTLPSATFIASSFRQKFVDTAFADKQLRIFDFGSRYCKDLRRILNATVVPLTRKPSSDEKGTALLRSRVANRASRVSTTTSTTGNEKTTVVDSPVQTASDVSDIPQIVLNNFPAFVLCAFQQSYIPATEITTTAAATPVTAI